MKIAQKDRDVQILFRVRPELRTQLRIHCAERNVTLQRWLERAIRTLLAEETKGKKP